VSAMGEKQTCTAHKLSLLWANTDMRLQHLKNF